MGNFRFCPLCGTYLSKPNVTSPLSCSRCKFVHYEHSRPCVGAVIFNKDKLLLIQRNNAPFRNHWDFPGGFLEPNELPENGLRREVKEEIDADIEINNFLGYYLDHYADPNISTLNIYYVCRVLKNEFSITFSDDEIKNVEWFKLSNLPSKMAFNHTSNVIEDFQNYSALSNDKL